MGASETRAAAAAARTGRGPRLVRLAGQRAQSEMAVGLLFAQRSHLPELAPRGYAGLGARLRDGARGDAPATDGSLTTVLEAGSRGMSRLRARASVAAREQFVGVGRPGDEFDVIRFRPHESRVTSPEDESRQSYGHQHRRRTAVRRMYRA